MGLRTLQAMNKLYHTMLAYLSFFGLKPSDVYHAFPRSISQDSIIFPLDENGECSLLFEDRGYGLYTKRGQFLRSVFLFCGTLSNILPLCSHSLSLASKNLFQKACENDFPMM